MSEEFIWTNKKITVYLTQTDYKRFKDVIITHNITGSFIVKEAINQYGIDRDIKMEDIEKMIGTYTPCKLQINITNANIQRLIDSFNADIIVNFKPFTKRTRPAILNLIIRKEIWKNKYNKGNSKMDEKIIDEKVNEIKDVVEKDIDINEDELLIKVDETDTTCENTVLEKDFNEACDELSETIKKEDIRKIAKEIVETTSVITSIKFIMKNVAGKDQKEILDEAIAKSINNINRLANSIITKI